jgi:hypothetical protein
MKHVIRPNLFSLPVNEKLNLPPRRELLPRIEAGEVDHLDFEARVFHTGRNRNFCAFNTQDLPEFGASFAGQPFLRNHDTQDIGARDGTILQSRFEANWFIQTIRLTTRRGMTDFVEGRIDRFSIGWFYDAILCSVCGVDWFTCSHVPGRTYETPHGEITCELIFTNPVGKETSAVNANAVDGTSILSDLQARKAETTGAQDPAVIHAGQPSSVLRTFNTPKGAHMKDTPPIQYPATADGANQQTEAGISASADPRLAQIEENRQTAAALFAERQRIDKAMQAQLEESNAVLIAQCGHLLDSGLASSRLPEVTQKRIRRQFEARAFKAPELQAAVDEARAEISALTANTIVRGPARLGGIYNEADKFELALEDLLGAARDPDKATVKVARLTGIREAYILATGDRDMVGGYFPEFALDTASFPKIVKNALNKRLNEAWAKYGRAGYDWWTKIVTVEHFDSLNQIDWLILGTIGSLPSVAERGEYTQLAIGDNGETSDWTKYGGYIGLTLEAILRDDVRAFKALPDALAMGGMRNISEQVAALFTGSTGTGPTLSDGGALFNATAVTTAGGHGNLLTTALGTDYTAWKAVAKSVYSQPMHVKNETGSYGTGKKQATDPKYCLVPRDLMDQARDLFLPRWSSAANVHSENQYFGQVEPICVPEWTDATDWAAAVDPALVPGVMLGEIFGLKPQIYLAGSEMDPAMFANDESRLKVRQFLAVGISNWRALHKNNVSG